MMMERLSFALDGLDPRHRRAGNSSAMTTAEKIRLFRVNMENNCHCQ